ncbi:MAG: RluA family pseudouridine synthase [Anaerolineaceae bacterium]|nr:RluA family pseudouridine synthase [Anaerolineaceae bacterium]
MDAPTIVIWEDDALLVVDKPAGLLSIPDGYDHNQPHLVKVLEPSYGSLWVVHRLDRETSGVMILARSARAHHLLNDQFAERRVEKSYHALILRNPPWDELNVEQPLRKDGDRRHRTTIDPVHGKPASTALRVIERFTSYCLIEAHPLTGYTHQIRAHLAFLHYPILADQLYGASTPSPAQLLPISRVALHAFRLACTHPITGEALEFEAPYPQDFQNALRILREVHPSESTP